MLIAQNLNFPHSAYEQVIKTWAHFYQAFQINPLHALQASSHTHLKCQFHPNWPLVF